MPRKAATIHISSLLAGELLFGHTIEEKIGLISLCKVVNTQHQYALLHGDPP